ncbi:uncharacterized protein ARMOST_20399 [Armillaria ostoyae]|uniref:Uncharacterized protein n=1 Tax=Armillaria ostoyae TaxID=47428 RepID=A0A284S795_ARMOS|nr:uncharacterized protein ARMOST_20399 [Armillaria ostoyae]
MAVRIPASIPRGQLVSRPSDHGDWKSGRHMAGRAETHLIRTPTSALGLLQCSCDHPPRTLRSDTQGVAFIPTHSRNDSISNEEQASKKEVKSIFIAVVGTTGTSDAHRASYIAIETRLYVPFLLNGHVLSRNLI